MPEEEGEADDEDAMLCVPCDTPLSWLWGCGQCACDAENMEGPYIFTLSPETCLDGIIV